MRRARLSCPGPSPCDTSADACKSVRRRLIARIQCTPVCCGKQAIFQLFAAIDPVSLYHRCIIAGQNPVRPFCLTPFSHELIVWRLTYTRAARSSCDIARSAQSSRIRVPISIFCLPSAFSATLTATTMPRRIASYHQRVPTNAPAPPKSTVKSSLHAVYLQR